MNHVRQCIKRISFLDKTLVDRAMKETARNRKMNNLNNHENMTTGQAYFNLNKVMSSTTRNNMGHRRAGTFGGST